LNKNILKQFCSSKILKISVFSYVKPDFLEIAAFGFYMEAIIAELFCYQKVLLVFTVKLSLFYT